MPGKAFEGAQPRAIFADLHRRFFGNALVGAGLDELAHPQTAGIARGPAGRQGVVGADHLVAVRNVGFRPQEQGPVVAHVVQEILRVAGHDLHVFGADFVGLGQHFPVIVADDHLAVVAPRLPGNPGGGQNGKLAFDLGHGGMRQLFGIGQQDRGRIRAVLGLAEQVRRA